MRPLLETTPVFVIRSDHAALHGAARFAAVGLRGAEAYASAGVG